MANLYALQQVGVADGTVIPAAKADGRQVSAKESVTVASKVAGQAWANGDKIFLGRLRAGDHLRRIYAATDTSFGTTTISIGTLAIPAKYVNAALLTAVNLPTVLGPLASTLDDGALLADEDIWITLGVGGVGGAVLASFDLEFASVK